MLASAEDDVSCLHEIIKVMLFTFVGSPHPNYTAYFLDMITKLEWESGPGLGLKAALLALSLVNLTGHEWGVQQGTPYRNTSIGFLKLLWGVKVLSMATILSGIHSQEMLCN